MNKYKHAALQGIFTCLIWVVVFIAAHFLAVIIFDFKVDIQSLIRLLSSWQKEIVLFLFVVYLISFGKALLFAKGVSKVHFKDQLFKIQKNSAYIALLSIALLPWTFIWGQEIVKELSRHGQWDIKIMGYVMLCLTVIPISVLASWLFVSLTHFAISKKKHPVKIINL